MYGTRRSTSSVMKIGREDGCIFLRNRITAPGRHAVRKIAKKIRLSFVSRCTPLSYDHQPDSIIDCVGMMVPLIGKQVAAGQAGVAGAEREMNIVAHAERRAEAAGQHEIIGASG